jgi:hypothetical protein
VITRFRLDVERLSNGRAGSFSVNDRPLFIGRNTATTGAVKQIDLRYSRFIPIGEAMRIELIGEFTNLFNIVNISSINQTAPVTVNSSNPLDPANGAPVFTRTNILTISNEKLIATGGFPQRIFQLGFKFHF